MLIKKQLQKLKALVHSSYKRHKNTRCRQALSLAESKATYKENIFFISTD